MGNFLKSLTLGAFVTYCGNPDCETFLNCIVSKYRVFVVPAEILTRMRANLLKCWLGLCIGIFKLSLNYLLSVRGTISKMESFKNMILQTQFWLICLFSFSKLKVWYCEHGDEFILFYFEVGHPWFLKEGFPKDFLNIITPNSLSQFNCAKVSKAGRSNDKHLHHHHWSQKWGAMPRNDSIK